MRIVLPLTAIAMSLIFVAGCDAGNGLDKVNGSVDVQAGAHVGNASTVNGSIDIGHDATVASAETVNGEIDLGPHAHANSLETVNGGIQIESTAEVAHAATTVNGSMDLSSGSHVGGRLENVNGAITLDHANVDGGIDTTNGDVTIGSGSIVHAGVHVEKPHGLFVHVTRKPRIVIASGAVVDGTLQFDRDVDLLVASDAKIGNVVGATPQPYSGK
ncbi:MAG TPA: hypothetical protein VK753_02480 [Xanthomonadaceae bacterium]|jgi:hypothetical protein|nr:hypothetical protein [Xanthomonadaceae bacterium]